jgi:phosphatidylinositol alpha-1,6-mannosyltransferase
LLVLTPDYPPAHGGIQTLVHQLALAITGFETLVVALQAPGAERFDGERQLATRRVHARIGTGTSRILALNASGVLHAVRFRPDVTLSAHVVTSLAATSIRRLLGGRTAQYFHANEILDKPRLSAFAAARADVAIAVSEHTASLIADTGASLASVRVIPPGVSLPSCSRAVRPERPTVLTIAQLKHSYKGHDALIEALSGVRERVPDVEWIVIGEGPLRPGLEQLARSRGLAGVARFLGEVSDEERDSWLRRAAVFAMPSRFPGEGFGIAYLEASAYGKPVVAGELAGALEAVAHGVSGLLVDPTDPVAVAEAVTRLLLDRELAQRLGRGGAARARDFGWPVIARRVEAVLLEAGGAGR